MRKFAFLLIFLLFIPGVMVSAAEEAGSIEYFDIYFLPEYEQSGVLVIMQIDFASQSDDGISGTIRLPEDIQDLVVARIESEGPVINGIEVQQQEEDGYLLVNFESITDGIWLEYYDPDLQVNGDKHSYTYTWTLEQAVEIYDLRVQQPFNATGFSSTPALSSEWLDGYGLVNYGDGFESIPAGGSFEFSFSYQKTDLVPSLDALGIEPEVQPMMAVVDQASDGLPDWALILIGATITLLVGGGVLYFLQQKNVQKQSARSKPGWASGAGFCHSCGRKAKADDVFCRKCGTRLRR